MHSRSCWVGAVGCAALSLLCCRCCRCAAAAVAVSRSIQTALHLPTHKAGPEDCAAGAQHGHLGCAEMPGQEQHPQRAHGAWVHREEEEPRPWGRGSPTACSLAWGVAHKLRPAAWRQQFHVTGWLRGAQRWRSKVGIPECTPGPPPPVLPLALALHSHREGVEVPACLRPLAWRSSADFVLVFRMLLLPWTAGHVSRHRGGAGRRHEPAAAGLDRRGRRHARLPAA